MNSDAMRSALRVTKALADRQRVRILMMLHPGELCVCQIVEVLALAPSTVSKHLSILSAADLVNSRKDGRWAYFRLSEGTADARVLPVMHWLRDTLENDQTIEHDRVTLQTVVACDPEALCRRQKQRNDDKPKRKENQHDG